MHRILLLLVGQVQWAPLLARLYSTILQDIEEGYIPCRILLLRPLGKEVCQRLKASCRS